MKKTASILIKCSPEWRAEVKAKANRAGQTVSEYIRQATEAAK